jgi:hypothetical protein
MPVVPDNTAIENFTQIVEVYSKGGSCASYWKILSSNEKNELASYLNCRPNITDVVERVVNYYNNYLAK